MTGRLLGWILNRALGMGRTGIVAVVVEVFDIRIAQHLLEALLASQPMKEPFDQAQCRVGGGQCQRFALGRLGTAQGVFELPRLIYVEGLEAFELGAFLELDQGRAHFVERLFILPFRFPKKIHIAPLYALIFCIVIAHDSTSFLKC
ncbi:MAG: hypothetical protein ACSHW1_13240 [Yoonia sp.]|uniref:hypothetical protein n=1 Tax=Yoonia sp. TaxID=2212373 RepID=UPI003EF70CE8